MNLNEFKASLLNAQPPKGITAELQALWFDAKNDWEQAHIIAQDIKGKNGSWIHAYLHRKEGDQFNADYWYAKAGKKSPPISLQEEWEELFADMI